MVPPSTASERLGPGDRTATGVARYKLGGRWLSVPYRGETATGPDTVLLERDDDLTEHLPWSETGWIVEQLLDETEFDTLRSGITEIISEELERDGMDVGPTFEIEQYHNVIGTDEAHMRLMSRTRGIYDIEKLPVQQQILIERISEILGIAVVVLDNEMAPPCFGIRIVRPGKGDHNPPHRDVWLDGLRNAINIYLPVGGSSPDSSLPVISGSHRWSESAIVRTVGGADWGGTRFTVPAVVDGRTPLVMERPNPASGQATVFSPYLIHGGARNFGSETTRVSVEMRFARA